ncbi:hypothetical protein STEG23_016600 [Scotinomys teguina]
MFAKRLSDVKSESESDTEFKDCAIVKTMSQGTFDNPEASKLEMSLSVKAIISKIEQARILRAKEEILTRLIEIMSKVDLIMTRYIIESSSPGRRDSIKENQRKKRKIFLEKLAAYVKNIDVREKILIKLLAWLEEWKFVLSEVVEIDIEEYHCWMTQMELMPEVLKGIDSNVSTLCRIATLLSEEKKRQKKRLVTRGTLWKAWKERVAKRPATGHALRPDQMISDQFALNSKVSEIQDMLQELISTAMFSKLENNAIKYISATVLNLSKALNSVSDEMRLVTCQVTNMAVSEEKETEKDSSQKVVQELSKENEMLHQKLKNCQEKCDQLTRIKNFLGRQLLVPTTSSRMLAALSPQAPIGKSVDAEEVDGFLNKELENIIDESQTQGVKATAIKRDSAKTYVTQGEMAPDVAKQQADQDQKRQYFTALLPAKASDTSLEREEKKVMEVTSSQFSDLDMKRKDWKSLLEGRAQGTEVRSAASNLWDRLKKSRSEHLLSRSPVSSEVKMEPAVRPMDKEAKTEAELTKAGQPERTPEPARTEVTGKKHIPRKSEEMRGATKQQRAKQPKTPKQTSDASPDARREQNNLESFQRAILAFLREKTDAAGKALDPKSIQEEEKSLGKAEVEKLNTIKAKMEEYFQKVAETVTKTLRTYREARKGQLGEKFFRQRKVSSVLHQLLTKQGITDTKSDIINFLLNEMTDPVIRTLTQTLLDEQESGRGSVTVPTAGPDHKDKRTKDQRQEQQHRLEEEAWKEEQRLQKQRAREKAESLGEWRQTIEASDMSPAQDLREREEMDQKLKAMKDSEDSQRLKGSKLKQPAKTEPQSGDLFKTFTQSAVVLTPRWMKTLKPKTSQVQLFQMDPRAVESSEEKQPFSPRTLPMPVPEQAQVTDTEMSPISKVSLTLGQAQVLGGPPGHEHVTGGQIPPPTAEQEQESRTLMVPRVLDQTLTPKGTLTSEKPQEMQIPQTTTEQLQISGVTVAHKTALPFQKIQVKDITLTSQQALDQGTVSTSEPVEEPRITLSPQQAQALGITLTPERSQAQRISLTPQQAHALELTLTPQQTKEQETSLTPQQAQALGITLTPEQTKAQRVSLTPQQAQIPGVSLTPQQAQALGIAITPEQAQALGIAITPELPQAQQITITPEEAEYLGIALTPQQVKVQGISLTPQQGQALGMALTHEQAQAQGIILTSEQAQALGITLTPHQVKTQRVCLTPEQAQALGIAITPEQAQALGIAITPEQAQALGITLSPKLTQSQEISFSPEEAQALGLIMTPQQAQIQKICLTPQQAQALGITLTPEQAKALKISLTPQQAQALGFTLTPEQAQALRLTLTPEQAQALGLTLTPEQAQALRLTLTPEQAQALGTLFTPSQFQKHGILSPKKFQYLDAPLTYAQAAALREHLTTEEIQTLKIPIIREFIQIPKPTVASKQTQTTEMPLTTQLSLMFGIPQRQGRALGTTLIPGQTQAFEQVQPLQPPFKPRQAPLLGHLGPEKTQTLTFTIALEKAQNLGVTFTQEQTQAAAITLTSEQVKALEDALTEELAWKWQLFFAPEKPASLLPSPDRLFQQLKDFPPTSLPLRKLRPSLSQAPPSPRTSLAGSILPDFEKLEEPHVSPTYRQILADRGQVTPTQLLTPEVPPTLRQLPTPGAPSTPGLPFDRWHFFKPGDTWPPLMLETHLTDRRSTPPLVSGVPPTSGESPGLVPGSSACPFQPLAIHEQAPYMKTYSTSGQPKPSLIIPEQGFSVYPVPAHVSTAEALTVPGRPQRISPSSVSQKRSVAVSLPQPESIRALPSATLGFEVSRAPFSMEKVQISKFSDILEETRVLQDSSDIKSLGVFQPYVTSSRLPGSKSLHVGEKAPSTREKSIASLPSLPVQLPQTSQIIPSERGQRPRLPAIDKPWILTPVPSTGKAKAKVVGRPLTAQHPEDRYFVDVEAQRKNLAILNQAAQTAGLPLQYHTIARNLIIELLHMNTVRLGYLSRKYVAYRLIQLARNNIIKRLRAIQNTGKGYETQNLFIMLDKMDHYQKKVMQFWTEKQKQLEQRRKHCLWSMMQLFGQLERVFKLNLSQPVPLVSDLKQIPDLTKFQRPVLELLIEDKKSDILKTLGEQAQMEAIWNADLSTSSYPITEKTSLNTLWAQLGGYPDIPRLLELDIQSTFRKSLASIRSHTEELPESDLLTYRQL